MSRFNPTLERPATVANLAGGTGYVQDARNEIVSLLLTSFLNDKAYRSGAAELQRVRELVAADPEFAARAAVYARHEFGMRSVSHVVAGEITELVKGRPWVRPFVRQVVRRPDDMLEIVAYRAATYGLHPLPNALKRGLADAFAKFDAYQLGKYKAAGKALSLVDLVNLVRPRPTNRNADAIKALVDGTLKQEGTWEDVLSAGGDKGEAWHQLIESGRLPYFALLRNLRNIAEVVDDEHFAMALGLLEHREAIEKSLVLPFRFLSAIDAVREARELDRGRATELVGSIGRAADHALRNVPDLPGKTLVALDMSGSMSGGWRVASGKANSPIRIGSLFAAALARRLGGRCDVTLFDTDTRELIIDPSDGLLTVAGAIEAAANGGGTNLDLVFATDAVYDRVIVLSDMQAWTNGEWGDSYTRHQPHRPAGGALEGYRRRTGANPAVFGFDLTGYGSLGFPAARCFQLAGWSDKAFALMAMLEQGEGTMVDEIERVDLS